MKPINVSITVDRPRDEVYEYLDVLANHEAFCDHFLSDWSVSGPAGGVGAKVRVKAKAPGPETWITCWATGSSTASFLPAPAFRIRFT